MRKILLISLLISQYALADEIQLNTFQNGEVADADEVNENFNILQGAIENKFIAGECLVMGDGICSAPELNNPSSSYCSVTPRRVTNNPSNYGYNHTVGCQISSLSNEIINLMCVTTHRNSSGQPTGYMADFSGWVNYVCIEK
ncbi:MAG: hypothetical protein VX231_02530 [Pseudomonadota bacterium]|nr:hypothetical protein [Pseudomonadota bacterium]